MKGISWEKWLRMEGYDAIVSEQTETINATEKEMSDAQACIERLQAERDDLRARLEQMKAEHEQALRPYKKLSESAKGRSDDAALMAHVHGQNAEHSLRHFLGELDDTEVARLEEEKEVIARQMYLDDPASFHLVAGLPELLDALETRGVALNIGTAAAMAHDALLVLDALEVDRAHVLGFSDGAIEGLLLARDHPDRIASLTAMSRTSGFTARARAMQRRCC